MNKRWFIVLLVLCAAALALSILWMVRPQAIEPQPPASAPVYLLKDCGGRLALYPAGQDHPIAVYDVYTRLLPEIDVLYLQQGIPVHSTEELLHLLEDYGL